MPFAIYILGLMIFSMTTSEFMVAGMMASLSSEFGVSIAAIGYLISAYAAGMIVGGPSLTVGLLKPPRKQAFLTLAFVFLAGQTLGALAPTYEVMMIARIITGVSSAACFGVSLAICFTLVGPESRGRAASIVLGGLMVATAIGLPLAMLFDQYFGWRASFWAVVVLVLVSGLLGLFTIPASPKPESVRLRDELAAFRAGGLWAAYATSMLIIGATFAAFSYFSPILTDLAGFTTSTVPLLLAVYGVATVIGNIITGRLADRYMMPILGVGLLALTAALTLFGVFAREPAHCHGGRDRGRFGRGADESRHGHPNHAGGGYRDARDDGARLHHQLRDRRRLRAWRHGNRRRIRPCLSAMGRRPAGGTRPCFPAALFAEQGASGTGAGEG
ncbi:MFS transporter [Paenibacillus sp. P25]|nr:MFS transporter [Paenibacillus sp. P25]